MDPRTVAAATLLGLILAACASPAPVAREHDPSRPPVSSSPQETQPGEPPAAEVPVTPATVRRVIDGDTIEVLLGGARERIRLIGIDTPERGQRFAAEATAFVRARAAVGTQLFVELDVEHRDRYGRVLAYVWAEAPRSRDATEVRSRMLNAAVLEAGLAVVLTIPPNVRYADTFAALQRSAREGGRGLWGARGTSGECDPSYPEVCIPPPPPDLDCGDIDDRGFSVRGDDPHRFDGDGNGRGCDR